MKVCVKYFNKFCHRNPLNFNRLQTHFISMACKLDFGHSTTLPVTAHNKGYGRDTCNKWSQDVSGLKTVAYHDAFLYQLKLKSV